MSTNNSMPTALGYLDSNEAHHLFQKVWEGSQLAVGLYDSPEQTLTEAAKKVVEKMDKLLPSIKKSTKILIIGANYGETARFLAEKYNCKIDALNSDEIQNQFHQKHNKAAELTDYITITEGSYDQVPHIGEDYDIIWAQDALLYAADKGRLFREAGRALKPEGRLIFTAIMQRDNYFGEDLEELLAHLQLEELTPLAFYKRLANQADLEQVYIREMIEHFQQHYAKLQTQFSAANPKALQQLSAATKEQVSKSLTLWNSALEKDCLNWGILQFQRRNV